MLRRILRRLGFWYRPSVVDFLVFNEDDEMLADFVLSKDEFRAYAGADGLVVRMFDDKKFTAYATGKVGTVEIRVEGYDAVESTEFEEGSTADFEDGREYLYKSSSIFVPWPS